MKIIELGCSHSQEDLQRAPSSYYGQSQLEESLRSIPTESAGRLLEDFKIPFQLDNLRFNIDGLTIHIRNKVPQKFGPPPIDRLQKLNGLVFTKRVFRNCVFNHVDLSKCRFENVLFEGCTFKDTSFRDTSFTDVMFVRCNADRADFTRSRMLQTHFSGCDLPYACFSDSYLKQVEFREPGDFKGADFLTAELVYTALPHVQNLCPPKGQTPSLTIPLIITPWSFSNQVSHSAWVAMKRLEEYGALPFRASFLDDTPELEPILLGEIRKIQNVLGDQFCPLSMYREIENNRSVAAATPYLAGILAKAQDYISIANGVFLPGGDNINPVFYGGEPRAAVQRDLFEFALLYAAGLGVRDPRKVPIFAVCRGMQVLHVYFGGKMADFHELEKEHHYDIVSTMEPINENAALHLTCLNNGMEIRANEWHRQYCVEPLDERLKPLLKSHGAVEACEGTDSEHWVGGVLFHPEFYKEPPERKPLVSRWRGSEPLTQEQFSQLLTPHNADAFRQFIAQAQRTRKG